MADSLSESSVAGKVQIEAFGVDLDGRQFVEETWTVTITRDGATIALTNKLAADSELIIRNTAINQEAVARVVDLLKDDVFVQVYGIAFIDSSVNLWQVEFPEAPSKKTTAMECGCCQTVEAVLLSEIEAEILEAKQSLRRFCACRDSSTCWKQTDRRVTERRAKERGGSERRQEASGTQTSPSGNPRDRRKEKRTPVKANACVRCLGEELVVQCEDWSRGGFRFTSHKKYPAGMPIQVAVPYVQNGANIFVSALIAYHQEVSPGIHTQGVAYVRSVKNQGNTQYGGPTYRSI